MQLQGTAADRVRTRAERDRVARTLAGEESAFGELVELHHRSLLRLARAFDDGPAGAERLARRAWLRILETLHRAPADRPLRIWMLGVLAGCARSAGGSASWPIGAPGRERPAPGGAEPGCFDRAGRWVEPPRGWDELPEAASRRALEAAIAALPPGERTVLVLRDVEGVAAGDACAILDLSTVELRARLHLARARVRRALDQHLLAPSTGPGAAACPG